MFLEYVNPSKNTVSSAFIIRVRRAEKFIEKCHMHLQYLGKEVHYGKIPE